MDRTLAALGFLLLTVNVGVVDATTPAVDAVDAGPAVDYLRDVKPILEGRCYACHGALRQRSRLRLDTALAIRRGGRRGPAVVPGKPDESRLLAVVTGDAGFRMPPEGEGESLTVAEIAHLEAWIAQGAAGPDGEEPQRDPRQHWSFRAPVRPEAPDIRDRDPDGDSLCNPIDAFVAARHAELGLELRPPASRETQLRRVFLDLIGVPPTRAQLRAFLADTAPDAYQRVVDRLLASPLHGQRWGRHWMDIWRYSDWYGRRPSNEIRYSQRHIWRWRDWIVESINDGKAYDRMLIDMLAGDELAPTDEDTLRATGFLARNWYKFDRDAWLFETVEQTSRGLLALTLRCARCHDHKFDPISQVEYYRFRAFFEPHDVRTDRLSAAAGTKVDNGKDAVLEDGLSRVFDAQPAAPTYLFRRGDDRNPDKERPLAPGVPAAFGGDATDGELDIRPVELPAECAIPELRAADGGALLAAASQRVRAAEKLVGESRAQVARSEEKLAAARARIGVEPTEPTESKEPTEASFLSDEFATLRTEIWEPLGGDWSIVDGRLRQSEVTSFATLVTRRNHPRDFRARLEYRTLEPGGYRSVGVSFDTVDRGNSQDVYTSVNDKGKPPTVQAFHRTGGRQVYPPEAIVEAALRVGEGTVLEIAVKESNLHVALNGEKVLDYTLPLGRRDGKFALWVHDGAAEFSHVEIEELVPSLEDLERSQRRGARQLELHEKQLAVARAERSALRARIEAERARWSGAAEYPQSALEASRAERTLAVARAGEELARLELELERQTISSSGETRENVLETIDAARTKLTEARAALESPGRDYERFEARYPRTSSGRRLALARWIAGDGNPRTARVAVNHIWLRHFGEPIVEPVDDFGLRSRPPSHPALLDWLAVELVQSGWDLKRLHRLMVTSRLYRTTSTAGPRGDRTSQRNLAVDPENRYLWRMRSRRMEAEVIRDSLLAIAGELDCALGGPELDETLGQTSRRRSLYFRTTPDNKMVFLELFDLANPNECYRRRESVVPQQALAMTNSSLALDMARLTSRRLSAAVGEGPDAATAAAFIVAAFERILGRSPTSAERAVCARFLERHTRLLEDPAHLAAHFGGSEPKVPAASEPHLRARENLVHVLFSHNDFVTVR